MINANDKISLVAASVRTKPTRFKLKPAARRQFVLQQMREHPQPDSPPKQS
jgi:hypothetical protein